ncbi:hypothetical protein NECAME_19145, partial [Necator americanus]
ILQSLIESAKANNITFVYSLSPGIDIVYSKVEERICIKSKLDQLVQRISCFKSVKYITLFISMKKNCFLPLSKKKTYLSVNCDNVIKIDERNERKEMTTSQVRMLGCESFALLFDDIECEMNETDRQNFRSFVAAQ